MKKYLLFILLILLGGNLIYAQTSYVTSNGAGLKNGTNWANAYDRTQLQKAIDEAATSGFKEVWVAAGTYKAGELPTSYFSMKSGVSIYGGFSGNEVTRDARNWVTNVTILSGEHGDPLVLTDNSKYVIYNDGVSNTALLDGFTITGGYNGIGLGDSGGGIANHTSSPKISNCIITGNTGSFGGGVYNINSSPTLTNCIISNNHARRGGAVVNNASSPTFVNCLLANNSASINGGAIFNEGTTATITFINCTVTGNTASTYGGAVANEGTATIFNNSIIWGNETPLMGKEFYIETGSITLDYSCYQNVTNSISTNPDLTGKFTATNSITLDPRFVSNKGKQYLLAGNSPAVDAGLNTLNNEANDLRGPGFGRKLNKADGTPGTIDMGAYEFKFSEDPAGGTTYTWSGATDTNWNNTTNWSTGVVPKIGDGAIIPSSVPFYPTINGRIDCYQLTVERGATLTITPTGAMTVIGSVTVNNGRIDIQSNATGTGSLIAGNAVSTPTVTVNRWLPANSWTMVSPPVSGQTVQSFMTTPMNNFNLMTEGANRGIADYNTETNTWNSLFTNTTTGPLTQGKGYAMRLQGAADATVMFTGALEAGPLSVPTVLDKWNCVGNPYTSAIGITSSSSSAENFLTVNAPHLDPAYGVYIWDHSGGGNPMTGSYMAISNVPSPTNPGFELQQGQAFMVKMKPTVNDVVFTQAMQVHMPALALKSAQADWSTIKLTATVNNQKSSAIIAFSEKMTRGLDPTFDAGLFKGNSDLSLYTFLVGGGTIPFSIQALPENQYDYMIIPVGIDSKVGGTVVFSAEFFHLPSQGHAILEDIQAKRFTDLAGGNYTATIAGNSSITDRFRLHASFLTTDAKTRPFDVQLTAYPIRNSEIRVTGSVSKLATATLYDIQGKVVLVRKLEGGSLNTIPTPNLKSGIYLLSVQDNQQVQRFKIVLTQ